MAELLCNGGFEVGSGNFFMGKENISWYGADYNWRRKVLFLKCLQWLLGFVNRLTAVSL